MNPPRFITFTGFDDQTSIDEMEKLSCSFSVEWGVLFSPKQQGSGRYPSIESVSRLLERRSRGRLKLAAHLCGGHVRDLLEMGAVAAWLDDMLYLFDRVQINTRTTLDYEAVGNWARKYALKPIAQSRDPERIPSTAGHVYVLHDASGGKGIEPKSWPTAANRTELVGFAGGLNPENVARHVKKIGDRTDSYWLDMETGVRQLDRFSVVLCEQVCHAVYPRDSR